PRWRAAADTTGVLASLRELAAADDAGFERSFEQACTRMWSTPCPWLDPAIALQLDAVARRHPGREAELTILRRRATPQVGAVPVALIDTRTRIGFIVELRVRRDASTTDDRFGHVAWEAMMRAFEAAASCGPGGLPRYPLEAHAFDVVGLPDDAQIDG